jgi:hypothetical protein
MDLLNTLRAILSSSGENNAGDVVLGDEQFAELNLDSRRDRTFVQELALLYFGQRVEIVGSHGSHLMDALWSILEFAGIFVRWCWFRVRNLF